MSTNNTKGQSGKVKSGEARDVHARSFFEVKLEPQLIFTHNLKPQLIATNAHVFIRKIYNPTTFRPSAGQGGTVWSRLVEM